MIDFEQLGIEGVFRIKNFISADHRGTFVKTWRKTKLDEIGFEGPFVESYYSQSTQNVLRGMHFQIPPCDHQKLVYVTDGEILDVVLDLRHASPTLGQVATLRMNAMGDGIFIPKGCAHGFLTLSKTATVVYNVTTEYQPSADRGVQWNSFGFDWPAVNPVLSERDAFFPAFTDLERFFT